MKRRTPISTASLAARVLEGFRERSAGPAEIAAQAPVLLRQPAIRDTPRARREAAAR